MKYNESGIKMKNKLKNAMQLFWVFFKIGAFTFGGGYAMISLIQREVVFTRRWMSDDDILDIIAIAESTPGPIAINSATFVGYKTGGFLGALFSTLGVTIPSFTIILIISFFLKQFENLQIVKFAFNGIRAGILALIIKALISMYKQCPKHIFSYIIMLFAFIAVAFIRINVLAVIIACALAGLLWSLLIARRVNHDLH